MGSDENVQFKRRAGSGRSRKRARSTVSPSSPSDEAASLDTTEGDAHDKTLATGRVEKCRGGWQGAVVDVRPRSSWRDEVAVGDANAANMAGSRARDQNATAARPLIDAADDPASAGKAKSTYGPLRAPTHIRTSVRVDYQPDVCKDYKETGYCGFGDACKFLHDRGDYKAGWQLDRDWAEQQKLREKGLDPDAPASKDPATGKETDSDGLPFACYICRMPFTSPVVTLCEHYFCEECAIDRMKTDTTCAVCSKQLRGVLNTATKLATKMRATHKV